MSAATAEKAATTNEAAFRFWLRAGGVAGLADQAALRRFAAEHPGLFAARMAEFAGVRPDRPDADALVAALAALLLDADLRPDDTVLVAGLPDWPWIAARSQGIRVVAAPDATQATLLAHAAAAGATAVAAPAAWLAEAGLGPATRPRGVRPGGADE